MTHPSRPQWRLFCLSVLMALAVAPLKSQTLYSRPLRIPCSAQMAVRHPVSCSFRGLRSRLLVERQLLRETRA